MIRVETAGLKACTTIVAVLCASNAFAQAPDTVLVNGRVLTVDAQFSTREALAIRDGKILALGSSAEMRKLAGPRSRVIDLQGRTVIPGLIDSHLHAIRAAETFATEVNWIGAPTLADALGRIRDAARTMKPGAWLIVAGGWNVQQFKENRRPTQAELVAAAPNNPVYIQLGYGWAMLTPVALKALNISSDADVPGGGRLEKDASGKPTGAISGGQGAIIALFDKLPKPTFDEQVTGTKAFFRELNRLGLTGVVDPATSRREDDRIGLTCAACHTGQIHYQGIDVRFDGGPAMTDLKKLELATGLSIAYTLYVPFRFQRFADRVLGTEAGKADRDALKQNLSAIGKFLVDWQNTYDDTIKHKQTWRSSPVNSNGN